MARSCVAASALTVSLIACNALVGWDELQRVDNDRDSGGDNDEDDAGKPTKTKDGTTPDAPDLGPLCDPTQPFGAPEVATDFDALMKVSRGAVLTPDMLEAYFVSGTNGNDFVLRRTTRPSRVGKWSVPTNVDVTPRPLAGLSIAAGGLKLFYNACTTTGTLKCENVLVKRTATSTLFVGTAELFVPDGRSDIDLFVVASDDLVYYSRLPNDGGSHQLIMVAPVSSNGVLFNSAKPVANISVPGFEEDRPVLNESQTVMYFSSNRPGSTGGGMDIWVARRKSKSETFSAPEFVPELSAPGTDHISWVSNDECEIFMNRADHVYYARRPP